MTERDSILPISFMGSYPSADQCPALDWPEYAFIGRSNVGKSSLINYLAAQKEIAHTSKKPGKTQTINLFHVRENPEWGLADLPGYGYAIVSRTTRESWSKLIDQYLKQRPNLMCTFLLIDVRHPLQNNDRDFLRFLGEHAIPFVIVFTKADKLKPHELESAIAAFEQRLLEEWESLPRYFVCSSVSNLGRDDILGYIREMNAIFTQHP